MQLRTLDAAALERALPMVEAVAAMKEAYARLAEGRTLAPARTHLSTSEGPGTTLVMPAYAPEQGLAVKIVSVTPTNRERGLPSILGLVVVVDPRTGAPQGLIDGAALTAWRTAAGSGASIDLLARTEARRGALLGTGAQARAQLLAMCAARTMEEIRVYSRTPEHVQRFVDAHQPAVAPTRLIASRTADEAVDGAEVVVSATSATTPLFDPARLAAGSHLCAVGSFTPRMIEFAPELAGQTRVFVDQRAAAEEEAGELIAALAAGHCRAEDWTELGEVVRGRAPGRERDEERTLFKSVGSAAQDVQAATEAIRRAEELGLGGVVEL